MTAADSNWLLLQLRHHQLTVLWLWLWLCLHHRDDDDDDDDDAFSVYQPWRLKDPLLLL
jgi:hypothetical protein